MEVKKATDDIANTQQKAEVFNTKIKNTYNNFAIKINALIDKIEELTNKMVHNSNQNIIWLEIEMNKLLKQLSDLVKTATDKINNMTKQAKEWYNDTVKNIKLTVVKSSVAKTGKEMSETDIEAYADTISHPSADSIIPEIKIELEIPVTQGYNTDKYDKNNPQHNPINLKKLPLL